MVCFQFQPKKSITLLTRETLLFISFHITNKLNAISNKQSLRDSMVKPTIGLPHNPMFKSVWTLFFRILIFSHTPLGFISSGNVKMCFKGTYFRTYVKELNAVTSLKVVHIMFQKSKECLYQYKIASFKIINACPWDTS